MAANHAEFVERTLAHYADKFALHGRTPLGVDWNGPESQRLQFEQVLKVLPPAPGDDFSLNDLGCGYGGLAELLLERHPGAKYHGVDLSPAMIAAAREANRLRPNVRFSVADRPTEDADYGVASGVFTLRLERSDADCHAAMVASLDTLHASSRLGFAFNCLTAWSDAERMRDYLYYPDPAAMFDHCKRHYARNVALLHDYGLYAFTVLVRKGS